MRIAPSTNATAAATPAPGLGRVSLLHASFVLLSSLAIARCGRSAEVPRACGAKQFAIFLGTWAMGWVVCVAGVPPRRHLRHQASRSSARCAARKHLPTRGVGSRRCSMLRPSATCCNPVQHVATQCNMLRPSANSCNPVQQTQCNMLQSLQPSATNPVQHVAARSADERQRLVADRATFHTGECEMQHVRRVRSGGRGCIHGGVWGAVRRQGVTGEGLSESQVRQSVCRDGTADLHRHRRERHAARTEDQIRTAPTGRRGRKGVRIAHAK